jgi:hypothetical protein
MDSPTLNAVVAVAVAVVVVVVVVAVRRRGVEEPDNDDTAV